MSACESTTERRAQTFNVREILERPTEIMGMILALAASVDDDEVLVCEAPLLPQPPDGWLRASDLELVTDRVEDGLRSAVFHRPRRDERSFPNGRVGE